MTEEKKPIVITLGRATFKIDTLPIEYTEKDAHGNVIGLAVTKDPAHKFMDDQVKELQEIFGSTEYLRIRVHGDPDAGLPIKDEEILISGYRFGLDAVIVNNKLLAAVHGDKCIIITNFKEWLEHWNCCISMVPDWSSYDGCYHMKDSEPIKDKIDYITTQLTELIDLINTSNKPTEEELKKSPFFKKLETE